MAKRRRRETSGDEIRGDEWMATFSDTITLLLTFFILLYSFSTVDQKKWQSIATSLQSVLTGQESQGIMENTAPVKTTENNIEIKSNTDEIYEKAKKFIEENKLGASVEIKEDERGVILQLRDSILFESGKADVLPESKSLLDKLGNLIKTVPNNIIVEGHTDNVPINTYKFQSNWDLSASRAVNVVKFFIDQESINAGRFTASGFGEYRPIVDNSTAENRAKNRRVNILIVAIEKEKK
ncbi:OmpA family protein [Clostridium sp. YIM B02505]|uniref:OmpA family protein n=1 Tax=Clostridium yunnanense TaxID=2800325 RepID=A0ABS1EU73_9CLOT|nr:OmpA family protein [Clostridium yunnanense]MBK1812914.1 OmpA family protein [Clostridium yunnanense]